jgi:type II secretory pathway pseudopilin PulG
MKLNFFNHNKPSSPVRARGGYTLPEMVVGTSSFILLGVIVLQFSTLRSGALTMTKLNASTGARQVLNAIRDQVRCAQQVQVGTYVKSANPAFQVATNGSMQEGNALQIYYDTTGTNFVTYYLDTTLTTNTLFGVNNGVYTPLAKYATNYNCFFVEDFQGNIQTNYINNPTIHVILQFTQFEYPGMATGAATNGANAFGNYRMETRVSRRIR